MITYHSQGRESRRCPRSPHFTALLEVAKTWYCGIDVAKHKHVALVVDEKGVVVKSAFVFSNARDGFATLLAVLVSLGRPGVSPWKPPVTIGWHCITS